MTSSSEPVFNKTKWGDIPKLSHTNYDEWKDDITLILSPMRVYGIISGDDSELQPLDIDYDGWKAKEVQVRHSIKGITNPYEMWNMQETSLDPAGLYSGRQDILRHFHACRPKEDEPLKAYFTRLSNYCTQLDNIDDAITDCDFRTQIFTSLPSQYVMILMVLKQRRSLPTPEEAMTS
ncbi:hypothetical protein K440DRAFT_642282 [Wilcoxina mikolae CBS 423.85]|nr:hypothetical protein K440DRAFT_642282 [Wilcoxina mikolae CBS 423.85]